jgi:hypothetical protein
MSIASLTPSQYRRAADLKERIDALQHELDLLVGTESAAPAVAAPKAKRGRKKRTMSAQGRANIIAGVAKREAAKKAANKPAVAPMAAAKAAPAKANGELSVKAAVLKALESGKPMGKKEIINRVSGLRGKKTNLNTLNPLLNQMKNKDKSITNPQRGVYKLK